MKVTDEVAAREALDALQAASEIYRRRRHTLEEELREELRNRLTAYRTQRDVIAARARDLNVPITKIGARMGTTNRHTVYEAIANGRRYDPDNLALLPDMKAAVSEFVLEGDVLTVTPEPSELESILPSLDTTALEAGQHYSAQFAVDADGRLDALTEPWTERGGTNPVIALVAAPGSAYAKRLREWLEAQA